MARQPQVEAERNGEDRVDRLDVDRPEGERRQADRRRGAEPRHQAALQHAAAEQLLGQRGQEPDGEDDRHEGQAARAVEGARDIGQAAPLELSREGEQRVERVREAEHAGGQDRDLRDADATAHPSEPFAGGARQEPRRGERKRQEDGLHDERGERDREDRVGHAARVRATRPANLAHVSDSLAPALLVAMPQLLDPNFRRSVVLLIHHDAEGTFGVVLNRTTEIRAAQLCESIEVDWQGDPEAEIHWGGPVQPQTGWVLFEDAEGDEGEDVREVVPGVGFAGSLAVLRRMALEPPTRLRILLGYAGWGPGQLETELAQGAWLVAPADASVLFETDVDAMWSQVVRSLGIEPATLVASRGVH